MCLLPRNLIVETNVETTYRYSRYVWACGPALISTPLRMCVPLLQESYDTFPTVNLWPWSYIRWNKPARTVFVLMCCIQQFNVTVYRMKDMRHSSTSNRSKKWRRIFISGFFCHGFSDNQPSESWRSDLKSMQNMGLSCILSLTHDLNMIQEEFLAILRRQKIAGESN